MARLYKVGGLNEELSFEEAQEKNVKWDVFVSHTTQDDALADTVARCIQGCGLTAWVDSDYMEPKEDRPDMAEKIRDVIDSSFSLLVIVTKATNSSWWVPFEIGIASEKRRFLSAYGKNLELPSFLENWPHLHNHEDLHVWCGEIQRMKNEHTNLTSSGIVESAAIQKLNYKIGMILLKNKFRSNR